VATERLTIQVDEKGALVVARNIEDVGKSARRTVPALDMMKKALLALSAVAAATGIKQLIEMADTYTVLQNKLRQVTTDTSNLSAVTSELYAISGRTRSSFQATAEGYAKVALASKELGRTQAQLLQFTESLNKAVVIGGSSSSEAAGGLRQLSQGLASGTLRGDELVSVLENLPYVADIIAKHLGVTRGELRKMGADGKIMAKDIIEAFEASRAEINDRFGRTVPTVGEAVTRLGDAFTRLVGELNNSKGVTASLATNIINLAKVVDGLGAYINTATTAVVSFGVAFSALKFASISQGVAGAAGQFGLLTAGLTKAKGAIGGITTLLAGNPIVLGLLAIAAAASVTVGYFDKLNKIQDEIEATDEATYQMQLQRLQAQGQEIRNRKLGEKGLQEYLVELEKEVQIGEKSKTQKAEEAALAQGALAAKRELTKEERNSITTIIRAGAARDAEKEAIERILGPQRQLTAELAMLQRIKPELTAQQYADETLRIESALAKTADPMKTHLSDMREEIRLLQLSNTERGLAEALNKAASVKGKPLEPADVTAVTQNFSEKTALEQERAILEQIRGPQETYMQNLAAIERLRTKGVDPAALDKLKAELDVANSGYASAVEGLTQENQLLMLNTAEREKGFILQQALQDLKQQGIPAASAEGQEYIAALQLNSALRDRIELLGSLTGGQLESYRAQEEAIMAQFRAGTLTIDQLTTKLGTLSATYKQQGEAVAGVGDLFKAPFQSAIAQLTDFSTNGKLVIGEFVSGVLQQIAQLAAQKMLMAGLKSIGMPGFATGGEFTVGGSGGTDSQLVAFRATPGEDVSVRTPDQQRQGQSKAAPAAQVMPSIKIVNIFDPAEIQAAMQAEEGEKVIINVLKRNSTAVRQAIA
jgi:tape measure domain-containing protein